jgi:hypothetical protein
VHDRRLRAARDVVAVEADIQVAKRDRGIVQGFELVPQTVGEERAATVDADYGEVPVLRVALGDLMGDARERSLNVPLAEDDLLAARVHFSVLASRDRVKGASGM